MKFDWAHFAAKSDAWWNPPEPDLFVKSQLETIQRFLLDHKPGRVLEVGVGRGRATPWIHGDWFYLGLEVNPRLLRWAHSRSCAPLILASGTHLPLQKNSFNMVVAFDVFMHIWERPTFLRECRRVLTTDGSLIFNFLRRFSPGWRQYTLARFLHPHRMWRTRDRRFDTKGEIELLLADSGFSPEFSMAETSVPITFAQAARKRSRSSSIGGHV